MSATFSNQVLFFPVPLTRHSPLPVRPAENEDVSGDLAPKNPIMPRKRRSNQCIQCDRYFLTQVKHSWQSMTFYKLYDLVNLRKIILALKVIIEIKLPSEGQGIKRVC